MAGKPHWLNIRVLSVVMLVLTVAVVIWNVATAVRQGWSGFIGTVSLGVVIVSIWAALLVSSFRAEQPPGGHGPELPAPMPTSTDAALLNEVEASLAAYQPSAAVVNQYWDSDSGLWCVDILPTRSGAAKVFITKADDELWLEIGRSSINMQLPGHGTPAQFRAILEAVFSGHIRETGKPTGSSIYIELANGQSFRGGSKKFRLTWAKPTTRGYEAYGPVP